MTQAGRVWLHWSLFGISWDIRRCIPMFPVCFPACARSHGKFGAESGLAAGERHGGRRGVPVPISTWIMPSPNDDGSVVYDVYFNVIYLWDWPFTDTFHDDTGNKTEELLKLILVRYSKWSQCKFYRRTSLPFFQENAYCKFPGATICIRIKNIIIIMNQITLVSCWVFCSLLICGYMCNICIYPF